MVSKTARIDPFRDPQILRKYSEEKRLDNLVFGKLFLNMRGEIVLQMSVYDKIKDRITITTEEKAKNIFEVFDTANRLVNSVVSEFSKMHIGFGNIISRTWVSMVIFQYSWTMSILEKISVK